MMSRHPAHSLGIVACLAVACLLLAGAANAEGYHFKDEAGRFAADFPAEPTLDRQEGFSPTGPHVHYTWEADLGDRHFSVTYTEYQTPPAKNYDNNVMGLLKATNGRLLHQAKIDLGGIDGREVVTLLPDNEVLRQRLFQVGNRLYQAVYAGPYGTESRPDVEAFMKSFQLFE
jgi:hypothetical protein